MNDETPEQILFYELSCYTQSHPDPLFIHQYIVDAYAAQTADENTKPITITFALIGLYLHVERNFTGKEVQNAHVKLGRYGKKWPSFDLPEFRGEIRVGDVIFVPEGSKRDRCIVEWCRSVWDAYRDSHVKVVNLVRRELWR